MGAIHSFATISFTGPHCVPDVGAMTRGEAQPLLSGLAQPLSPRGTEMFRDSIRESRQR